MLDVTHNDGLFEDSDGYPIAVIGYKPIYATYLSPNDCKAVTDSARNWLSGIRDRETWFGIANGIATSITNKRNGVVYGDVYDLPDPDCCEDWYVREVLMPEWDALK
jgi:hypothetical protein